MSFYREQPTLSDAKFTFINIRNFWHPFPAASLYQDIGTKNTQGRENENTKNVRGFVGSEFDFGGIL